MKTRNQSNTEFPIEAQDKLNRHESDINQIHQTLQTLLTEM